MKVKIIILMFLIIIIPTTSNATDEIIESQLKALDMSEIITEGKKYTKEIFPEINMDNYLNDIIQGKINNKNIFTGIIKLCGKEVVTAVTTLGSILIVIVIHSILKNIGENLGNESVSKIAYFVEYILIVSIITANFSQIIKTVSESVANLVGFTNSLIPILIGLISATGQITTVTVLYPVLLFSIILVGNLIKLVIIPLILIATVIDIVSNLSDKVQVGKLAKLLKKSTIWCLGFIITIFVGTLSLEGILTSSVDGVTVKGIKTLTSTFVPVVGKALGDSVDTVLRSYISNKKCSWIYGSNSNNRNMHWPNNKINNFKYNVQPSFSSK